MKLRSVSSPGRLIPAAKPTANMVSKAVPRPTLRAVRRPKTSAWGSVPGHLRLSPMQAVPGGGESVNTGAFDIEFGKPSAPEEYWGKIANDARASFLKQVEIGAGCDVLLAALDLASEDDAISTKTHIPLPIESFSKRLDTLVSDIIVSMPADASAKDQLEYAQDHLYNKWGLKLAKGMADGEYSPYRVYMHQVLAQRCGTPASVAAILTTLCDRLRKTGKVSFGPTVVGIPSTPGADPVVVEAAAKGDASPSSEAETQFAPTVRWVSELVILSEMLDQLKRFYWSWAWPLDAASGFEACARALAGDLGRAGLVNPAVGVMQATGRPYGNVTLSVLAAERLALVTAAAFGADSWEHAIQMRDYGTLLLHVGRINEGLDLLERFQAWANVDESRASAAGAFLPLVDEVVLAQRRRSLDKLVS